MNKKILIITTIILILALGFIFLILNKSRDTIEYVPEISQDIIENVVNRELTRTQIQQLSKAEIVAIAEHNSQYVQGSFLYTYCSTLKRAFWGNFTKESASSKEEAEDVVRRYIDEQRNRVSGEFSEARLISEDKYLYRFTYKWYLSNRPTVYELYIFKSQYFEEGNFNMHNVNSQDIKKIGDIILHYTIGSGFFPRVINSFVEETSNQYVYTAYLIYSHDEREERGRYSYYKRTRYSLRILSFSVDKETGESTLRISATAGQTNPPRFEESTTLIEFYKIKRELEGTRRPIVSSPSLDFRF